MAQYFVSDSNLVRYHENLMTTIRHLIDSIDITEQQIQADWTITDTRLKSFIKNKPDIQGMITASLNEVLPDISAAVHTHSNMVALNKVTDAKITAWDNGLLGLAVVAKTGDYNDLINRPSIPEVPAIPTLLSELSNDVGYITRDDITADLGHVHGNLEALNTISTIRMASWDNKSNFSGSYGDLVNKPNIPGKTSDLVNDSGYVTNSNLASYQLKNDNALLTDDKTITGAINEIKQSVSDGKSLLASAITDMGVEALASETFSSLAEKIRQITTTTNI